MSWHTSNVDSASPIDGSKIFMNAVSPSPRKPSGRLKSWQLSPLTPHEPKSEKRCLSTSSPSLASKSSQERDRVRLNYCIDESVVPDAKNGLSLFLEATSPTVEEKINKSPRSRLSKNNDTDGSSKPAAPSLSPRLPQQNSVTSHWYTFVESFPGLPELPKIEELPQLTAFSIMKARASQTDDLEVIFEKPKVPNGMRHLPYNEVKTTKSIVRRLQDFNGQWHMFRGQMGAGDGHLKALGVPYLVRAAIRSAKSQTNVIRVDGSKWVEKILNSGIPSVFSSTTNLILDGTRQQVKNPLGGVVQLVTTVNYKGRDVVSVVSEVYHQTKSISQTITRTLNRTLTELHVRDEMRLKNGEVILKETSFYKENDGSLDGDEEEEERI